jgi:uncharacterized Zn-binding protein involved in type VI secretion
MLMAGEIIRLGDSTSHGGMVIEGSQSDICMGKPIAYVGHKVLCPLCKGQFPIVEGAQTTTFYGKGFALAGMRTSCGALLIASQFTDVVEYGVAGSSVNNMHNRITTDALSSATSPSDVNSLAADKEVAAQFDDRFFLLSAMTGEPLAFVEYALRRESGELEHGTTDEGGLTHMLSATTTAEVIDIYVQL